MFLIFLSVSLAVFSFTQRPLAHLILRSIRLSSPSFKILISSPSPCKFFDNFIRAHSAFCHSLPIPCFSLLPLSASPAYLDLFCIHDDCFYFVARLVLPGPSVWPLDWKYPLEPGTVITAIPLKETSVFISSKQLSTEEWDPRDLPHLCLAVHGPILVWTRDSHLQMLKLHVRSIFVLPTRWGFRAEHSTVTYS